VGECPHLSGARGVSWLFAERLFGFEKAQTFEVF
jgi:hypothetical protein